MSEIDFLIDVESDCETLFYMSNTKKEIETGSDLFGQLGSNEQHPLQ